MLLTTVTYLRNNNQLLMLHRVKKENDINAGYWLGVGGKFESGETPYEAARREITEETGFIVDDLIVQGIVTFVYPDKPTHYIFVFRGDITETDFRQTREGILEWVDADKVMDLALWEGDKLFLPYVLDEKDEAFSLKLVYDENDNLLEYHFDNV